MKFGRLAFCFVLILASCSLSSPKAGFAGFSAPAEKPAPSPSFPASGANLSFPIRAAFFYPWFPEAWDQEGIKPFTQYHPGQGNYSQDNPSVIQGQVAAMKYGKIQLGIASWWGQRSPTDQRVESLLKIGEMENFSWALYFESEGYGNPSPDAIRSDLDYIRDHYASSPAYLKIDGRFVVFVYADPTDGCDMVDRWVQANTELRAYLVLKVFPKYRSCSNQPDGWHQYAPSSPQRQIGTDSFTISPGFWRAGATKPLLDRDLSRWSSDIQAMIASNAKFQLITTFNEWGEGTAVESAQEWASPSGYGAYLDLLHYDGVMPESSH